MKTFGKFLAVSAIALSALVSTGAIAATDGTLGATSTGTSAITLSIAQRYQISGISDLAFGTYSGSGDLTANDDVCIYTNDATAGYKVRMFDSSTLSAAGFSVQNTGGNAQIPYTVKWNTAAGTTGNVALAYNTAVAKTGANTTSTNCAGGNNANFQVNLLAADMQMVPSGSYSTTLSITIEP